MIVAGGIYLEACVAPASTSLLGSGGRAALAISSLDTEVELHAFQPAILAAEVYPNFEPFGVKVHLYPAADRVSFHYLHPLSRPRITPVPLPGGGIVAISGDKALRFGCLEGSFQVTAKTVVFDPQSVVRPEQFGANGSKADRLALVLNRAELARSAGTHDLIDGAEAVLNRDGAEVVVVKSGPDGAYIFQRGTPMHRVPAFAATAVHKVGSGDTFSAAFAHYWASENVPSNEAARLASLHTADYVETRRTILAHKIGDRTPMVMPAKRRALVCAERVGASAAWMVDEAACGLRELGIEVEIHDGTMRNAAETANSDQVLVLLDPSGIGSHAIETALRRSLKVVAYVETAPDALLTFAQFEGCTVERDFATALYRVAWA